MTKSNDSLLTLGYDLNEWNYYGVKTPIVVDISPAENKHQIYVGLSGSGKSYHLLSSVAKLIQARPDGEYYFAAYKSDDLLNFMHENECKNYYFYKNTLKALDLVYERFQARLENSDTSRHPICLIWDEYIANVLSIMSDKKLVNSVLDRVSELLVAGRALNIICCASMTRCDAFAFPAGSRMNYGIIAVIGGYSANKSIYEMVMPEFTDIIKARARERDFERGEGVVLLQGSKLKFIKVATVDMEKVQGILINALSKVGGVCVDGGAKP